LTKILNRDTRFTLVTYQQLVGVCLYVFARPALAPHLRDVAVDSVKTGMGGAAGNKGAVAIRFRYHATSMCFVCSHFAAGQNNITDRNGDYAEAVKKVVFPKGRTLLSHDYVFWCGDFNYRINIGREDVKALVAAKDWAALLAADQLKIEQAAGNVFKDFQEGEIDFAPTYKYDLFSEDYDTSEKCRVPAWTDRVLWRRRKFHRTPPPGWTPGVCRWYGRAELKQSDHRPIMAILDVEALELDEGAREKIFEGALAALGPPDGSVLLQFENMVSFDVQNVIDDHFMAATVEFMEEKCGGKVRFAKFVNEMVWVAFVDHSKALAAAELGPINVCGHDMTVRLKLPDWRKLLDAELDLCSVNTMSLCGDKDLNMRRESARLLSQLSQLSFEELEDMTMPEVPAETEDRPEKLARPPTRPAAPPARPGAPPGRPAAPPGRPAAPPARPAPPPARPAPPPSRPAPPVVAEAAASSDSPQDSPPPPRKPPPPRQLQQPTSEKIESEQAEHPSAGSAGFSDIFAAAVTPGEADLPISSSSGSIVALAAGTGAAVTSGPPTQSSSSHSLEYPENYDPLAESGKAWVNGVEQTIPGQQQLPARTDDTDEDDTSDEGEAHEESGNLDESLPPPADAPPPIPASASGEATPTGSSGAGTPTRRPPPPPGAKRAGPPPPPPGRSGPPPPVPGRGPPPPVPKR